jgi:arylsulfatase A-like enzyme
MDRPNILVVVMDTARAQSSLPQENPAVLPNLKSLAEDGVTFTQAITTAPWTLPSHASMFTGQYTRDHGTHAGNKSFSPEFDPLPELLQKEGYNTVGISNNTWISPTFGFGRGFDDFYQGWELFSSEADLSDIIRSDENWRNKLGQLFQRVNWPKAHRSLGNALYAKFFQNQYDSGALLTNHRIKNWINKKANVDSPFFMFINYVEPHLEYDPPRSFRYKHLPSGMSPRQAEKANQDQWGYISGDIDMKEWEFQALEALYTAELEYIDYRLGKVITFLRESGVLENTFIVVLGDHGENIGNHGLMDHQYSLHDTLLRVPMIFRYPESIPSGKIVESQVEVRDLFPTILDVASVQSPKVDSISRNRLVAEEMGRDQTIAEYVTPQPAIESLRQRAENADEVMSKFNRSLRCIRTDRWKYIQASDGSEWLFNLRTDPDEIENVVEDRPETAQRLLEELKNMHGPMKIAESSGMSQLDDSTQERLRQLGYI